MRTLHTQICPCGEKFGLSVEACNWLYDTKNAYEVVQEFEREAANHMVSCAMAENEVEYYFGF